MKTPRSLVAGMIAAAVLFTTAKQVAGGATALDDHRRPGRQWHHRLRRGCRRHRRRGVGLAPAKLAAVVRFYDEAVARYTAASAFGSTERWAETFGISADNPIRVVYAGNHRDSAPARARWIEGTAVITHYKLRTSVSTVGVQLVLHELAHVWDGAHGWALGEAIATTVQNPEGFPTAKARDEGPREDFAESVTATLWPGYAVNQTWSDNELGRTHQTVSAPDSVWTMDRRDYVVGLF